MTTSVSSRVLQENPHADSVDPVQPTASAESVGFLAVQVSVKPLRGEVLENVGGAQVVGESAVALLTEGETG